MQQSKSALNRYIDCGILVGICVLSLACGRYAVSLNDKEIYTPPPLLSNFTIDDRALRTCINQSIVEKRITLANQLTQLLCPATGILSIAGLEQFPNLAQLDISENSVVDIKPLTGLPKLKEVKANWNTSGDCETVKELQQRGARIIGQHSCDN